MKASIIVPSHNACERLYYNLLSLNAQCCDRNLFEVIVIDNASEDNTKEMLKQFNASFDLKIITLQHNVGRAYARNRGLEKAEGDIILFHDSDMIAEAEYVEKHIAAHTAEKTIVCGDNWSRIYSYYYKNFKGYLIEGLRTQIPDINKYALQDKHALLQENEVINGTCFERSFKFNVFYIAEKSILERHGDSFDNYSFPWSMVITNNCSIEKKDIREAGGFDESFRGWGYEDIDLGYRLYKLGCKFKKRNDIRSIHQEHPIDFADNGWENLYSFSKKYQSIDVLLFYYGYLISINKYQANEIVLDISKLQEIESSNWFIELYRKLLMLLRDKYNIKLVKESYFVEQIKAFRDDILSNKDNIKKMTGFLEGDVRLATVSYTFKAMLKKVLMIDLDRVT